MPPSISKADDDSLSRPFSFLHPGIGKTAFQERSQQPHIFQQSVTLTASMWNEDEFNKPKNKGAWNFDNWEDFTQYSPLFVGLFCGFAIVLLLMSTVMLWRYCWVSATKKVCCKGTYGEMTSPRTVSIKPLRNYKQEEIQNENGFEDFHVEKKTKQLPTLQRSSTVGSLLMNEPKIAINKYTSSLKLNNKNNDNTPINPYLEENYYELLMAQESPYSSHKYLPKAEKNFLEISKHLSRSTPALEDMYAKVNFSKKKKNRMRKGDAAVIALSKSLSAQNNNTLAVYDSAVVVYNERTAL